MWHIVQYVNYTKSFGDTQMTTFVYHEDGGHSETIEDVTTMAEALEEAAEMCREGEWITKNPIRMDNITKLILSVSEFWEFLELF